MPSPALGLGSNAPTPGPTRASALPSPSLDFHPKWRVMHSWATVQKTRPGWHGLAAPTSRNAPSYSYLPTASGFCLTQASPCGCSRHFHPKWRLPLPRSRCTSGSPSLPSGALRFHPRRQVPHTYAPCCGQARAGDYRPRDIERTDRIAVFGLSWAENRLGRLNGRNRPRDAPPPARPRGPVVGRSGPGPDRARRK